MRRRDLLALLAGCASISLAPANAESRLDGQVVVVASDEVPWPVDRSMYGPSPGILNFRVENLSPSAQMKVDRDAVFLVGPAGRVNRKAGGSQTVYTLGPGEVQDVNVRFPLRARARSDGLGTLRGGHHHRGAALGHRSAHVSGAIDDEGSAALSCVCAGSAHCKQEVTERLETRLARVKSAI